MVSYHKFIFFAQGTRFIRPNREHRKSRWGPEAWIFWRFDRAPSSCRTENLNKENRWTNVVTRKWKSNSSSLIAPSVSPRRTPILRKLFLILIHVLVHSRNCFIRFFGVLLHKLFWNMIFLFPFRGQFSLFIKLFILQRGAWRSSRKLRPRNPGNWRRRSWRGFTSKRSRPWGNFVCSSETS